MRDREEVTEVRVPVRVLHEEERAIHESLGLASGLGLHALSGPATAQRQPAPTVHTLEQLTQAASQYNPGIRAADHAIDAAEARLDEIRFSPFFQFTAMMKSLSR